MTRARDRVPTVQIEIPLAATRVDPTAFAPLRDDRHLLVRRELELLFERLGIHNLFCRTTQFTKPHRSERVVYPRLLYPFSSGGKPTFPT